MSTGRMNGTSTTKEYTPNVELVSLTDKPIETLFSIWFGSRNKMHLDTTVLWLITQGVSNFEFDSTKKEVDYIKKVICDAYPEIAGENHDDPVRVIHETVKNLVDSDLPPLEAVQFTFMVDDVPVAWRDQLVRGRRAMYWTQTSRTADLSMMDVNVNRSISRVGDEAVAIYENCVDVIRDAYKKLQDLGVPGEDIRLSPASMIQRDYWTINLRELIKVMNKRSDWIAQATMWTPILSEILRKIPRELADLIRDKSCRPNVKISKDDRGNLFVSDHHYDIENLDRYEGRDPQPCDPLWLAFKGYSGQTLDYDEYAHYQDLKSLYISLWSDEYLEVLGWCREDPTKKGYYDPQLSEVEEW